MPSVRFNVDDLPDSFPPLPEDQVYTFEVDGAEVKQGPKGPYVNGKVKVVDHPELTGRIVFEVWPLPTPEMEILKNTHPDPLMKKKLAENIGQRCFRTKAGLLAMGRKAVESGILLEGDPGQEKWNAQGLLGQRFQAKVYTDNYQGQHRSKIKEYLPKVE